MGELVSDKVVLPFIVSEQLEEIRKSGVCNMLEYHCVMSEANDSNFMNLVMWMHDNKVSYVTAIMFGFKVGPRNEDTV